VSRGGEWGNQADAGTVARNREVEVEEVEEVVEQGTKPVTAEEV